VYSCIAYFFYVACRETAQFHPYSPQLESRLIPEARKIRKKEPEDSDSRIVNQDINLPPLLGQAPDEAAHLGRVADVELHGQDLDALADLGDDVGGDLLEEVEPARGQDQAQGLGGGAGELERGAAADARRGARDQDRLALEALGYGGRHGGGGAAAAAGEDRVVVVAAAGQNGREDGRVRFRAGELAECVDEGCSCEVHRVQLG
jgi:hypothetical protein